MKRLPRLPEILDAYVHTSDESLDDFFNVIGGFAQIYTTQWMWRRTARKVGPVLLKVRNGEKISMTEARLLLTTLTLSVYLASRNAYAGWQSAQQMFNRIESINKRLQAKTQKQGANK